MRNRVPSTSMSSAGGLSLKIRSGLERDYADVFTSEVLEALRALAPLDEDRKELMEARIRRRTYRIRSRRRSSGSMAEDLGGAESHFQPAQDAAAAAHRGLPSC